MVHQHKWGFSRDSAELEVINKLKDRVAQKLEIARSDGFDLFPENWLVIYENLHHLPGLRVGVALPLLRALSADATPFDRLVVLAPPEVLVCRDHDIDVYPAPALRS